MTDKSPLNLNNPLCLSDDPRLHLRREVYKQKNPATSEEITGNTPVGVDGFEPPTLCL